MEGRGGFPEETVLEQLREDLTPAYFTRDKGTSSYARVANKKCINYPVKLMAREARGIYNSFLANISGNITVKSSQHLN